MAHGDTIGIGIIGSGFARTTQLPAFRACEGARVVAIASGHRSNAEAAAREFDIPVVASDWRELVARADVDIVSIATPPLTHAEMTFAALDAGKAVLCEKPMAMNAEETGRMRAAAQEAGTLALIDHELRFLPARRMMREMILGGEIGRVRRAKVLFRTDARASAERGWNWWSDAGAGGGTLGAIGSHAVDALQWILGARVSHVSATLTTHVSERRDAESGEMRRVETDDETDLLLNFADGDATERANGVVSLSMVEAGQPERTIEVFGSEGALRLEGAGALWQSRVGEGLWRKIETDEAPLAEGMRDNEWSRGFAVFARAIMDALREGRTSVEGAATFTDGHRTQLVLDAARAAHDGGRRVAVVRDEEE
jgi:predicted dehydrogenase